MIQQAAASGTAVALLVRLDLTRIGLAAVLVAESLYLTGRFDSQALDHAPSLALRLLAWSPQYLQLMIASAAAFALLQARRPSAMKVDAPPMSPGLRLAWFGCHLLAFLLLVRVSSGLFVPNPPVSGAGLQVTAWVVLAAVSFVSWTVAFMARSPVAWSQRVNGRLAFTAAGLGVVAWVGGLLSESLWRTAAGATFALAEGTLQLIYGDDVVSRPARLVLGARAFRVAIAPSCSGLEGVGLILAFLGIYLWLFRRELRFPAALALLPIGALSIWLLNVLRIVVLIVLGASGWRDVALGGFHSQAGWITFNAVALGFVAVVNRLGLFKARAAAPEAAAHDSTAPYLVPFIVVIATGMVTGAFSSGLDWLYPVRVVAAAVALWLFRRHYAQLRWTLSWHAVAIGVATFAIWIALSPAGSSERDQWPAALRDVPMHWAAAWLLFRVVGFTLTVPLVEELAFRVYLTRRLIGPDVERLPVGLFTWFSFVVSSVLFGLLHGGYWLAGTVAGMSFAVAMYKRRAAGDAVLAHATTNGLIAVYVLTTGRWSVWS